MSQKQIQFTNDQKNLIFAQFVAPQKGTKNESDLFIEVCETFGLNPLTKEIVFQRRVSRDGIPAITFITTRDGYLSVARRDPNFVGAPLSAVVKEGDEFAFSPTDGSVVHKFGSKRGKIIGAWAVIKHKKFDPVSVFVDYDEYAKANSNSPVWGAMPSAMIQKIAEVFVLRRQFPLSGLYTAEELGEEETVVTPQMPSTPAPAPVEVTGKEKAPEQPQEVKQPEPTKAEQEVPTPAEQEVPTAQPAPVAKQETAAPAQVAAAAGEKDQAGDLFKIKSKVVAKHPKTGADYYKLSLVNASTGEALNALAKEGEVVERLQSLTADEAIMIITEENGFKFVQAVA